MLETLKNIMTSAVDDIDDEIVMMEDFEAMLVIASAKLRSFRMWRTICKIDFEDPVFARFSTGDGMINGSEFIRVIVLEVRLRLLFLRTFLAMCVVVFNHNLSQSLKTHDVYTKQVRQ